MAEKNAKKKNAVKKPMNVWQKAGCIVGAAIVIGLLFTLIGFFGKNEPTSASADLQLTFEGAAEGKAPDGFAFSIDDLTSDEVINEALIASGLAGKYTPEQIRSGLVITGQYPENLVNETMSYDSLLNFTANRTLTVDRFHPTLFHVTIYDHFDRKISKVSLEKLLKCLLTAYQSHFAQVNVQGVPEKDSMFVLSDYDYPQQLQILEQRLQIMSAYASEMYEQEPSFRYSGTSFNDIVARITNLLDSDIGRLNANMTLNALTKDPDRLSTQYKFELRDLNNRLSRRKQQLASLDTLIDSYEKSEIIYISTAESFTKIDGNSTQTYDALVDLRKAIAAENTATGSRIAAYRLKLTDLIGEETTDNTDDASDKTDADTKDAGENDTETETTTEPEKQTVSAESLKAEREAFEAEIKTLSAKCDSVSSDFSAMVKAWNASKLNELSVTVSGQKYNAPKLVSGDFIKAAIKTVGPIVVLAVIVCLGMIIVYKKKQIAF